MLRSLDVPYIDTRAADLRWSLRHARVPALASLTLTVGGHELSLQILGASHQVILRGAYGARPALVETVAYLPDIAEQLPRPGHQGEVGAGSQRAAYDLTTHVHRLDEVSFAAGVRDVVRQVSEADRGVVATFPGDPTAVTALLAHEEPGGIGWRSWHAYPQHGELVETCTRLTWHDVRQEEDR